MIYVIHPDYQHYKSFVFDSKLVRKALGSETQFHFSRSPKQYSANWKSFDIKFESLGSSKKASMPDVMVRNGRLFLTTAAHDILNPIISSHGEFLPITYDGNNGFIFNVLSIAEDFDGVDKKLSTKNEFGEVQSLLFNENKLKNHALFRAEFDNYLGMYCDDALKNAIEDNQLKGITFSNDTGKIYPPNSNAMQPLKH
ncbi:MAG: hypothetical protein K0Q78_1113 [Cellvibrio sp.]|jgi:hypothetical protein|nr:hypothetical protein [Cellvibrio sp.]